MTISHAVCAAALTALVAAPAFAQESARPGTTPPNPGQWTFNAVWGANIPFSGDLHAGTTVAVASLAALDPSLPATPATLQIRPREWADVYGAFFDVGVGMGYGISETAELFAAARYASGENGDEQVGELTVPALGTVFPVVARFHSPDIFLIEGGIRVLTSNLSDWFFGFGDIAPFIALSGGGVFTDGIEASFSFPGTNALIANVPIYDSSWSWTAAALLGFSWSLPGNAMMTFESGVRYVSAPDGDDSRLAGLGLAAINEEGERWSVPLTVRVSIPFQAD